MALEWTYTNFQLVAPALATVPEATFNVFAAYASDQLNRQRFVGPRLVLAGCYLTAHLIATSELTGFSCPSGGAVASESVGGASISYAVAAGLCGDLGASRYGVAFNRLARFAGCGGATS